MFDSHGLERFSLSLHPVQLWDPQIHSPIPLYAVGNTPPKICDGRCALLCDLTSWRSKTHSRNFSYRKSWCFSLVAGVHCCHLRHDIYKNSLHIQKSCNHDISTCILPAVLNLHRQIIACLLLWEKAHESAFTPVMRHCRMPCTSCCRGRATCTGWEYMLLFKDYWQRWRPHWKVTVPSAVLSSSVKFCHVQLERCMK
jgi:hypothetical protein